MMLAYIHRKLMLQRTDVMTCKPNTLQTEQEQRKEPTHWQRYFQTSSSTIISENKFRVAAGKGNFYLVPKSNFGRVNFLGGTVE